MPKIFTKNCKIKVIEYGDQAHTPFSWKELKSGIRSYITNLMK